MTRPDAPATCAWPRQEVPHNCRAAAPALVSPPTTPQGSTQMFRSLVLAAALSLLAVPAALAQTAKPAEPNKYLVPFPAHHVIANIYFVGSEGQANYLITTPAVNILLNSGLEANVPMIKDSIAKLGFKYSDTKILLIS